MRKLVPGRRRRSMAVLLFRAYVAGLFDGEGCVWWDRTPRVAISSCYPRHLAEVRDHFGFGRVRLSKPSSGSRRAAYQWQASGGNALEFLREIQPWLREKRYQSDIMLTIAKHAPRSYTRTVLVAILSKAKRINHA